MSTQSTQQIHPEAFGQYPTLPIGDLRTYHRNPRKGDVNAILGSLQVSGQYKPLVVNKGTHTGRPNEVLAGNHTLMALRELAEAEPHKEQWRNPLVHMVDVDDQQADRIVAVDNRSADLGSYDQEILAELLSSMETLDGTGYTDEDLAKLLGGKVTDPTEGDADTNDDPRTFGVVVECETEAQQVSLLESLEAEGFNVRALM